MMTDEPLTDAERGELEEAEFLPPFPRQRIGGRIETTLARRAAEAETTPASGSAGSHPVAAPDRAYWRLRPALRSAATVAASLLLFIGGAEYGRRTAMPTSMGRPPQAAAHTPSPTSVPIAIQSEGTEYVAAITRLAELGDSLTPQEREQAREVAVAVLYAAALQLLRDAPEDAVAEKIYETVAEQRLRQMQTATREVQ